MKAAVRRLFAALGLSAVMHVPMGSAALVQDKVLCDFKGDLTRSLQTRDATVTLANSTEGAALRVSTGYADRWPGITLLAPSNAWDLSAFKEIAITLRNAGTNSVTVHCRVDNTGADGVNNCVSDALLLGRGSIGTLRVPLKRTSNGPAGNLFGMRGYPAIAGGPGTINPSNITQILIFISPPSTTHIIEIDDVRATGNYTAPTAWLTDAVPFLPLIDTFGQYRHKDWPGKIHSNVDLAQSRRNEADEIDAHPAPRDWDKFGGWADGPQLEATGFFRAEKFRGKWWLVDPQGHLFWSHGIDCVGATEFTPVEERETWFADFPGDCSDFSEFVRPHIFALKGHYAKRSPKSFSFAGANLLRKYGTDWKNDYREIIHQRLRSWGLNTIGNWSDEATRMLRRTPYTDAIGSARGRRIEGSEGYWGQFPDPFDPEFRTSLRANLAAKNAKSVGDPWCIGFFSDNELAWGDELSLAKAALRSPATQPAKQIFIDDLKRKYTTIEQLNAVWKTTHASFDALLQSRVAPSEATARDDLGAFYTRVAEEYFRIVRDVIREGAPKQLYLGCRFAWGNVHAASAAAKYCDVVSYNLYRWSVADFEFNGGRDVPLIIGEFHFGALDRGMFHTGLVSVANQCERAAAYRKYVEGALRHPQLVGCHWFQYMDEPTTGRVYDEENYQIGFVDIADTPYRETIDASRAVAANLYRMRCGSR
jgi:hypothetical protein